MPGDRKEIGPAPVYVTCNPLARFFPAGWKDIWFRRQASSNENGDVVYTCPICERAFDHRMIGYLHGDHIWPYSLFGETIWANYQLICGDCNLQKSNKLDADVRKALSGNEFREWVRAFLQRQVESTSLSEDAVLKSILSQAPCKPKECTEKDAAST